MKLFSALILAEWQTGRDPLPLICWYYPSNPPLIHSLVPGIWSAGCCSQEISQILEGKVKHHIPPVFFLFLQKFEMGKKSTWNWNDLRLIEAHGVQETACTVFTRIACCCCVSQHVLDCNCMPDWDTFLQRGFQAFCVPFFSLGRWKIDKFGVFFLPSGMSKRIHQL